MTSNLKFLKLTAIGVTSGLLLALAWPTYGFPLLLFVALVPLLFTLFHIRNNHYYKTQTLIISFLAFFIWNMITVGWLSELPIGYVVFFATGANAFLMALVFLIYQILSKRATFYLSSIFLVCLWLSFEYMHLHWEFSFPWLNLGNGFSSFPAWIQWYEYTGTFGGSLWVLVGNLIVVKGILLYQEHRDRTILFRLMLKLGLLIVIPLGISLYINATYEEEGDELEVVLLQPNVDPYSEKYNVSNAKTAKKLKQLTDSFATPNTNFIIAPETVFAQNTRLTEFPYSKTKSGVRELIEYYPQASFVGGISMIDVFSDSSKIRRQTNYIKPGVLVDDYNSAFIVRQDGSHELYNKTKLVVGVENFPYQDILKPLLGDAMLDLGGTVLKKTTQEEREVFYSLDSVGVGPIICYESIYGEFITGYIRNGADFLAIITNDGWWGDTEGHRQHLTFASLRAIENRRSIARSANTGISAIINQKGEIVAQLGYEETGAIRETIRTNDKITFYAQMGNYIPRVAVFLCAFVFLYIITPRRK